MRGRSWAAIGGIVLSLALSATASAQTYTPGGRTLGDRLPELANVGNTGYDVQNYDLTLNYDPVANLFNAGTKADITIRATQNLSQFSLEALGDLPGLEELKGTGLLDSRLPTGFNVPTPSDDPALREDEDPLEIGDLDLALAPAVEPEKDGES
jgi:hypothetical protein